MLSEISIEILQRCPNRCIYCSSHSNPQATHIIPFEIIKNVIDEAKSLGCKTVCLSGGEPFLHPQILDIISYIAKQQLTCYVYTSGIYMKDEVYSSLPNEYIEAIRGMVDKVIFNVEIPNYNMMLEKKNLKEEKFINYIAVYNDGDCRGYVQNETPNLTQNIDRAMHFENENEANKFISKLIKRGTFSADELYVEGEYFNESIKNMKESNFKKSDAKVALQNVLKNGEEFDIPFKYSDEWEFTDAIEDELERQAFEFEGSFWDKNYGLVYEYSDGLETVYVIMDRSLSNRGICVGLVTEL